MIAKSRVFVPAMIVVCACFVLYRLQAKWLPPAAPNTPPIEVEVNGLVIQAKHLAISELWEQKSYLWELPIENRTGDAITIKRFSTSCGCLSVEPKSLTIPARESRTVAVAVDTRRRDPNEPGKPVRTFSETVDPMVDGKATHSPAFRQGKSKYWALATEVRSRVTFDTLSLQLGEVVSYGENKVSRRALIDVHVPFQRVEAKVVPAVAAVEVKQIQTNQFELRVLPNQARRPGRFQAELIVDLVDEKGKRIEAGWLPIEGTLLPEVRPIPARLVLPSTKVGDTAEAMFLLQPPDAADILVGAIAIDSPAIQVDPTNASGIADGRAFVVRLKLLERGEFSTTIRFTIRRAGLAPTVYPMEVWCRGL